MKFLVVKPEYGVMALIIFGMFFLALPVLMLINGFLLVGLLFLILWAFVFFFGVIHNCFIKSIVINAEGVRYITLFKSFEMKWKDIELIGIGFVPIKKPGAKPWIYFSADKVALSTLTSNMINDRFFMMNYRKNAIDVIKKYWASEITGLENFEL